MNFKAAQHKLSRRMKFRGLPISIETDKGELRHWFDPHENKSGTTKMRHPYGYIRRTEGVDGDHVDCYVGPNERAKNVYIVHQMKAPEFKTYDEDKCMLGFLSADEAKKAYLAHYNKPGFFGSMTTMPFEEFEKKVKATFEQPKKIAAEHPMIRNARRMYPDYGKPNAFRRYTDHGPEPKDPKERALNRQLIEEQWRADDEETATMDPRFKGFKGAEAGDDLAALAPALGGLVLGMPTGRALAGHAAAGLAPYGRKTRTDDIARRAAYVGAPLGGIAALGLSHHYDLPERLAKALGRGTIVDKKTEQAAIRMLTPVAVGLGGSALGGLATGAITGGIQRARGPSRRRSEDVMTNKQSSAVGTLAHVAENPELLATIREALTHPAPALRGTLQIGAQGKRFIPHGPDISLDTLRREALHQPRMAPHAASPMQYNPEDIMTSAKMSAFLKQAQRIGACRAIAEFRKHSDAALGDPNYWQGGTDAVNAAQQQPPQPQTAEEAIGLLPGGTFQGLNTRITADGQRSTTVKATPDVMQDPSGIQAIFSAEPGAKVELSNPETAMPGTQVPVQGAEGGGAPEGSPGQPMTDATTPPEAAGGAGDPGIGKVAALLRAGRAQALEKMASMTTGERIRKAGPAVGATVELASALLGKRPATLGRVLSHVGTGATVGWLPDIAASGVEALR